MSTFKILTVLVTLCVNIITQAFVQFVPVSILREVKHGTILNSLKSVDENNIPTRRSFFFQTAFVCSLGCLPSEVFAKSGYAEEAQDKEKIVKGYKRLDYLLNNWDKETTICGRGQDTIFREDNCDRNPEKVMQYLGFKSMNDPLYRADKTLMRLSKIAPSEYEGEFIDAVEVYTETSEEASNIAFISSWGEANPGGGKDRVEIFIERSKRDVIKSRDSLGKVIRILKLNAE